MRGGKEVKISGEREPGALADGFTQVMSAVTPGSRIAYAT
jgi:hypothetical protein